jgi:hypothetical protein
VLCGTMIFAQTGLPGDNLNLFGVLNIFQGSQTLEQFERNINNQDTRINNLDLNNDGRTDYINVIDRTNGYSHAIVLRVNVNELETQDIAVIEVERDLNGNVQVQIVGDEELYGENYIVEPSNESSNYVPILNWSIINHIYNPYYTVYVSPYRWGYYPGYWSPWSPVYYDAYYGYHSRYYNYYRRGYIYRSPATHSYYAPHRSVSPYYRNTYRPSRPSQPNYRQNHQMQQRYQPQHSQPQQQRYQQRSQPQQQRVQPQQRTQPQQQRVQPQQQRVQPQQRTQPQRSQPNRSPQQRDR